MATYVIGDVQGCFTSLLALLDRLDFDRRRDRLWFAGDLVNRGPASLAVLRFVRDLGDRAITVLGNHDLHLLSVGYHQVPLKRSDTFTDVLSAPDRDTLLRWLCQQPLVYEDATSGVMMLHAGLPPQWTTAMARVYAKRVETVLRGPQTPIFLSYLANQNVTQWHSALTLWEQLGYITNCLTRLRYCDANGRLALDVKGPPGTQPAPYRPWFAFPERLHQDVSILFGHWAALGAYTAPGIYALDTGCVWGGQLTALCLESRERLQVNCCEPQMHSGQQM